MTGSLRRRIATALLIGTSVFASEAVAQTSSTRLQPNYGNLSPFYGNISPFYGNISPFYGNISPFYGNISPFWGNLSPFWGNISPFYGNISPFWGNISPFGGTPTPEVEAKWGKVGTFWTETGTKWGEISAAWGNISPFAPSQDYAGVAGQIGDLVSKSSTFWNAAVQAKTGKSFDDGFAKPMLTKYGIDLAKPETLAKLDAARRSQFFLDWYDGLMNMSGADRVDHWMKTANWNPRITQAQGSGADTTIGLVDFFVSADDDIKSKVKYSGGYTTDNGHGAGVGSLMVASHDGKGVMGIAPGAKVAAYNPFDSTFTASWTDVEKGMVAVAKQGASVINLSLGVKDWTFHTGWRDVFKDGDVMNYKDRTIYVIAAGNDGVPQTKHVNMKDTFDNTFLVVGSVDPTGKISEFSNTPGNACLTEDGKCENIVHGEDRFKKSGYLKNRFIVAPGELILVSDGQGGTVRRSGTSFAAPLVSGAIALIHDRWPWLKEKPRDVAKIILDSAIDLGDKGIDDTYGVGMLDVEGSQSPLNFAQLKYYIVENGHSREQSVSTIQRTGVQSSWETKSAFFSAFEKVESEERDFLIPLSSRLTDVKAANGQYFQDYIYNQMVSWIEAGSSAPAGKRFGLTDAGQTSAMPAFGEWQVSLTGRLRNANPNMARFGVMGASLQSTLRLTAPDGAFGFAVGRGDGAVATGAAGFAMSSDYAPETGGANPLLGFASGGAHASVQARIMPGMRFSVGTTQRRTDLEREVQAMGGAMRSLSLVNLRAYQADAAHARMDYTVTKGVSLSAAWTRLNEDQALLGIRSLEPSDFGGGSRTDGVTLGADVAGPAGFTLSVAANRSRTSAASQTAMLRADGLEGSAYQVSLAKAGLFGGDYARLSLSQPLATNGTLSFDTIGVVDRQTGEKGVISQTFDVGTRRRLIAEGHYGTALMGGAAQVSLFARGELKQVDQSRPAVLAGFRSSFAF